MIRLSLKLLFLMSSILGTVQISAAQDAPDDSGAILVLDASGSMWGKIDDKHKITIARDVVAQTVSQWDTNTELGLIAYGHNAKGDCNDIETLIAPGTVDADAFNAKTKALNPKGKTPLTAAVLKAAEELKYREAKATVILVSDGKETCDLDPCAIGKTLEETGVDFTAHIIGFDVPQEDIAGLQCLADETGGMFIEASDTDELMDAMNETREVITDKTEPVMDEATLSVPVNVPAGSRFNVEWDGPANRKDQLVIRSVDGKTRYDKEWLSTAKFESPAKMRAPETPGTYTVFYEAHGGIVLGQTELIVVPVTASVSPPAQVTAGARFELPWTGPSNSGDKVLTFNPKTQKWMDQEFATEKQNPATLRAPENAGTFLVRYETHKGKVLAEAEFEVLAAIAKITAPGPQPAGSRFTVKWTGPENPGDHIRIYEKGGSKRYSNSHAREGYHPAKLKAPEDAGTYEIRYETHKGKFLDVVEFDVTPVTASIESPGTVAPKTKFTFNWTGPVNSRDRIYIYDTNDKRYKYGWVSEKNNPMTLLSPEKPGQYELRYLTENWKILARAPFEVK